MKLCLMTTLSYLSIDTYFINIFLYRKPKQFKFFSLKKMKRHVFTNDHLIKEK